MRGGNERRPAHDDVHMRARTAIVVVTYNSAPVLGDCLRSLARGAEGVELTDVVVVDNASRDGTLDLAETFTDLPMRTVHMGRNAGYAAGINAGVNQLDLATLDSVLVINPDCRLAPGGLATLADVLTVPGRGIAVPRLVNPDGSLQPSLRRTPTVRRALVEAVIGGTRAGRIGKLGELVTDPREYERAAPAAWATGAAMLISVDALLQTGPWDESFLLYSEETEFALRAADLGWSLWYEPAAVVEHIGGDSDTNPMLAALLAVNKVRLFRRRRGFMPALAYYIAVVLGESARAMAGRQTSRASVAALLRPSRRIQTLAG
ncbi:glycosyl transferase family protein [Kutzneria sp. CA-103260]|nr:glycosyl transferase family protein [Kutzneria sp. CA-103260]